MALSVSDIRKKIFLNSGLIVLGRFIGTLSSLLIVPMNIRKLGMDGFGEWGTIWATAAFFSILNLALGSTMLWQSSTVAAENLNRSEYVQMIRRKVGIGVFIIWLQFGICSVVTLFVLNFLLKHIGLAPTAVNQLCLGGSIFLVLFSGYSEIVASMLSGQNYSGLVSNLRNLSAMMGNLAIFVLLVLGWGLQSLLWGFALNYMIFFIGLTFLAWRKLGTVLFWPRFPCWHELKMLMQYTGCSLVGRTTAIVRTQFTCIALANLVSFEWAGYYSVALKISTLLLEVNSFFMIPMIAFVNKLKQEQAALTIIYRDMVIAAAIVSGVVATGIIAISTNFLNIWLSSPNLGALLPMIFILMMQYMIALIITGQGVAVCQGDGRIYFETAYLLINLILNILFLWLMRDWGGWGIMLAAAVSWIIAGSMFSYFIQLYYHLPSTFPICLKTVAATLLVMGLCWWEHISDVTLIANNWLALLVKGAIGPTLFLLILLPVLRVIPLEMQKKYLLRLREWFFLLRSQKSAL